ncbi:unnamed protein product [Malus baccata var. baccata]
MRLRFANGFNVEPIGKAGGLSLWWDEFMEVQIVFSSTHVIDAIARVEGEHRWVHVTGVYGPAYTWRGLRNGEWVEERLDRGLINGLWQEVWPTTFAEHGPVLGSNHCPIVIMSDLGRTLGCKQFRFMAFWAKEEECQKIVEECWARWSRNKFKQRGQQIEELTVQLVELQKQWGTNFQAIQAQEASFWHQRSRVKWLREGDLNTKFFHQSTLQRRRRNMILKLKADDGQWVEHPSRVRQMVEDHFQNLFKFGGPRHWGALLDCVPPGITEEMNRDLIAPVSDEEIKAAVMNMGRLKAPRPDGFQGIFYQSFWEDLKTDVHSLIRTLLHEEVGPNTLNATHVVLIPNVPNPEMVSQFHPISLCNYSYKVLSKVLANRLKVVLPNIISSSQNAFVAGRQIHDNIGIAHEMFHFLKGRKAKTKYELGLKIDIQKAYDRVEWDFLDAIMGIMGFCNRWRQLIMGCVSSVQFAILLNGQPRKSFVPFRGLRQGDPLSPFLFLLVGEADGKNCRNLVDLINMYCDASGQQVNFQKSSVYFGANIPKRVSAELANILRVKVVHDPGAYLGVPAIWGRSKKRGWRILRRKLWERFNDGSINFYPLRVKAVVQAIPAYPMYIFKFPATMCHDFDTLVADFWWGSQGVKRKTHWVSKEVLGLPKDMGGLGFRNFSDFNDALLAKQCWRLLSDLTSFWARDVAKGGRASWAWTSLLVGREVIRNGSHWQIMGGRDVRVWVDCWLPFLPFGHPEVLGEVAVSPNLRVISLICHESLEWDIDFLLPFISEEAQLAIKSLPLGDFRCKDRLVWDASKNGKYSVKSGHRWLQLGSFASRDHRLPRTRVIPKKLWNLVWSLPVIAKIRFFFWLSLHRGLATREILFRMRVSLSPICPICNCQDETIEHLFLQCLWVTAIWFGGALNYRIDGESISSWADWLLEVLVRFPGCTAERKWVCSYVVFTVWFIWRTRCEFVFNQVPIHPIKVLLGVSSAIGYYWEAMGWTGIGAARLSACCVQVPHWIPPSSSFYKINVDASWSLTTHSGFAGVVIRDANGQFMAAERYAFSSPSVAAAEATALLRGCELGSSLGFQSVILESDSRESIDWLSRAVDVGSWEAYPVLTRVKFVSEAFQFCRWSWVPRTANGAVDFLASRVFLRWVLGFGLTGPNLLWSLF